ncbi:flagellar basal-body rod protein FlgG [Acetitomaculum ruminis DSM 5522]|uniref:Flagellar basal-body rod protein FlgG n=1 Tax=Acetitomaculum ruminis DSM 5522 TaxID=1120918 RepID=A0A1I0YLD1_9FIRM|nr:flagellar hook-basal body protein [Acetitomaculum ruminis]SFB12973.1 flagellar basal-body rod protein FlgG [Acetitomaculum ruminis DSM 5522]
MMRALWSAASGMISQQTNVDTISNNIANVNTVGYKTEKAEFKSLLYQTIQSPTTTANGARKPIDAQVGLGSRTASITSYFTQGSLIDSENDTAFAIEGRGFFAIRGENGETYYTRNGNFGLAVGNQGMLLTDSDGHPVLDTQGNIISFPADMKSSALVADRDGSFYLKNNDGSITDLNIQIGLFQFSNPAGLKKLPGTIYEVTDASGEAMNEATTPGLIISSIKQGYLENSNVQVADEMVNLIVAQRAYEMNSKAIQAADDMLNTANNLRR